MAAAPQPAAAAVSPAAKSNPQLLRFATAGSVDDGKSTLIGRLLYDAKSLHADTIEQVEAASKGRGDGELDLALLTDGLRAEREQGITIDVAYRHFATPRRRFIIADTPGHAQYTRNMVTGASTADLAIVLVDAREGLLTQSRRHAAIAGLLGIPRVVLAVNKMDLVDYDQDAFRRICGDFRAWAARLEVEELACIPISALKGDNVVERSENLAWFGGPTLLQYLEEAPVAAGLAEGPLRLPVQWVVRDQQSEHRGYAGQLASGTVNVGDEVVVLPAGTTSRVTAIDAPRGRRRRRRSAALDRRPARGPARRRARRDDPPRRRGAALGPRDRRHGLLAGRGVQPTARALPAQAHDLDRARGARHDPPHARGRAARRAPRRGEPLAQRDRPRDAADLRRAVLRPLRGQPHDGLVHPHRRGDERDGRRGHDP